MASPVDAVRTSIAVARLIPPQVHVEPAPSRILMTSLTVWADRIASSDTRPMAVQLGPTGHLNARGSGIPTAIH